MPLSDDTRVQTLHSHYQESFTYIRERERQRDRLFLILVVLLAILFIEIQYPVNFQGAVDKVKLFGGSFDINALPLAAILNATWTIFLVLVLRYCQVAINIERKYTYLHYLEGKISSLLQDDNVYRREGRAYEEDYPLFLKWVWIFYTLVFPLIVILGAAFLLWQEFAELRIAWHHKLFDVLVGLGVIASFILYRIIPLFRSSGEGS